MQEGWIVPLSARQKAVLAITLLVVGGLVFAFLKMVMPLINQVKNTGYEVSGLEDKRDKLKIDFHNHSVPKAYVDDLKPVVAVWKAALDRRAKLFTTTLSTVPATVKTPEFFFDGALVETQRRLRDKSRRTGILIPPDLGIAAGMPLPEEVEGLLNQMSNGAYVLDLAMDSGVTAVTNLTLDMPREEYGFINLIPIQVSLQASMDALKKFLLGCSNGPQYLNVNNVSLRPVRDVFGGTKFDVDLVLTTTWLSMEKPAKEPEAEPTGLGGRRGFGRGPRSMLMMRRRGLGGPGATPGAPTAAGDAATDQSGTSIGQ
jgi:hypothetical protein